MALFLTPISMIIFECWFYLATHCFLYLVLTNNHWNCSREVHSLVSPDLPFTAKTYHAMCTRTNRHHSVCIPLVTRNFHSGGFFFVRTVASDSQENCFSIIIILMPFSLRLTFIFNTYLLKDALDKPSSYVHQPQSGSLCLE